MYSLCWPSGPGPCPELLSPDSGSLSDSRVSFWFEDLMLCCLCLRVLFKHSDDCSIGLISFKRWIDLGIFYVEITIYTATWTNFEACVYMVGGRLIVKGFRCSEFLSFYAYFCPGNLFLLARLALWCSYTISTRLHGLPLTSAVATWKHLCLTPIIFGIRSRVRRPGAVNCSVIGVWPGLSSCFVLRSGREREQKTSRWCCRHAISTHASCLVPPL